MLKPENAGCWFDGCRGIYIGEAVIKEAIAYGWDRAWYEEGDFQPDAEFYPEAVHAAEDFLDALAPEGYWIGFNDGDFGMYECETEEV